MNHLLCRGRAVGTDPSEGAVYAGLYSSADPLAGVAPGEHVQLGLSVAPADGAPRGFAYLLADSLADGAEIVAVQGVEYFPEQGWFRVRAEPGETQTGVVSLLVGRPKKAPRLRPQIIVAVPDASGRKLIRTGRLSDAVLPVHTVSAPGLRIVTEPNTPGSVHATAAVAAGSSVISVTQPAQGSTQLSPDGWVTYLPAPGFLGYDRFQYTVGTPDSTKLTAAVNVFVGPLDRVPGAFPPHTVTTEFHRWQWPELTGTMPWPRSHASSESR
ncbi:Ig-like domain-containing protein [Streptomyces sp. NBC_01217]|uniref:Ig-like domain-containing protein n=1 Tax=Streptomyces sp. NBC_01217 TaxID=2903779 RepID=UPI002E1166A3|nr:cadherin-like domain-containing protein [Streptomyces sp. NBC_01217]